MTCKDCMFIMKSKCPRMKMPPAEAANDMNYSYPFEYEDDWFCGAEPHPTPIYDRVNHICRFYKEKSEGVLQCK